MRHITRIFLAALLVAAVLPVAGFAQELPEAGWLAKKTAETYRAQARYPDHSVVLEKGIADPIRSERVASKLTAGLEDGPKLDIWTSKMSFETGAPVDFYAQVRGAEVISITAEVVSYDREMVGTIDFLDNGADFDKAAEDGVLSGQVAFEKALRTPELADNYMVKVEAMLADGSLLHGTSGFLYSRPYAHLTGKYRDRVRNGNLEIQAQVEVHEKGRFYMAGVLSTLGDEPIGFAQTAQILEPGKHWITLEYYGLMFHDRQVAGPYKLASVDFRTTGGMPNAFNDLVTDAHVTKRIPLKALTTQPFGNADLLRAAETLEADAGVRVPNKIGN